MGNLKGRDFLTVVGGAGEGKDLWEVTHQRAPEDESKELL